MALVFPIRLDKTIFIQMLGGDRVEVGQIEERHLYHNYDFVDNHGSATQVGGYDSSSENNGRGLRLTNLSSIRDDRVMKLCANNECLREFPVGEFSTRTTNERRDQSYCTECRENS